MAKLVKDKWQAAIERRWYGKAGWLYLLLPLTLLFRLLASLRRRYLIYTQESVPIPVIVVGNINVGGTGKTPLTIALVKQLEKRGLKPGVVSRGYGSNGAWGNDITLVSVASSAAEVGDEPLLISRATKCPVIVGRNRLACVQKLANECGCDVVVSDDGLQHYRLPRVVEIAVVDIKRGLGNGHCLPVGPLREPPGRLAQVDWIVVNGHPNSAQERDFLERLPKNPVLMSLDTQSWCSVHDNAEFPLESQPWTDEKVYAVAAIGNPQRFFSTLEALNIEVDTMAFVDHHVYKPKDFDFAGEHVVLMTAKDAVKCRQFARSNWWSLEVAANLPESFWVDLFARLEPSFQQTTITNINKL